MGSSQQMQETFQLGPFTAPRLFNSLWQLSSNAWGSAPSSRIRRQMAEYAEQGYTAFGEDQLNPETVLRLTVA